MIRAGVKLLLNTRSGFCKYLSAKQPLSLDLFQRYSSDSLCKTDYEKFSDETLDTLSEYFEGIAELDNVPAEFDISLESGVLTIHVSKNIGTYVINKQSPNKQIWLSSPISGPKRYDFVNNTWVYAHDGGFLHQLLEKEFTNHLNIDINLSHLPFYYS